MADEMKSEPIDKEAAYDEQIRPLVAGIIEICKRENIPFLMQFGLREASEGKGELYCLTAYYNHPGMMKTPTFDAALRILQGEPRWWRAMVQTEGTGK